MPTVRGGVAHKLGTGFFIVRDKQKINTNLYYVQTFMSNVLASLICSSIFLKICKNLDTEKIQ